MYGEYIFGGTMYPVRIKASSLGKAVRKFRATTPFPHDYSTGPIKTHGKHALESTPGSVIPVYLNREEVARISVESPEDEAFIQQALSSQVALLGSMEPESAETALVQGTQAKPLSEVAQSQLEIERRLAELEELRSSLQGELALLRRDLQSRAEKIWMIELYLGSEEEVVTLRTGASAPDTTKVTVVQQVLCMDEEIAVHDWSTNPERIGEFDYSSIEDFDNWLSEFPEAVEAIFPYPKGIVALRPRRYARRRGSGTIQQAFSNIREEELDNMTYLLVRNGENLYRIYIDVKLYPNLYASVAETESTNSQKNHFAGLMAIQGMLERSTLLHPLPVAGLSVVNPLHSDYFRMIDNGEGRKGLMDPDNPYSRLTWSSYSKWLSTKLDVGVRALLHTNQWGADIDRRTGRRTIGDPPPVGELYTVVPDKTGWYAPTSGTHTLMYRPRCWKNKRAAWGFYVDEAIAYDFVSWRVLEYLLHDRNSRPEYGKFFKTLFYIWSRKKKEAEEERPFVQLVLNKVGLEPTEQNIRRVELMVRWWKIKTKTHRSLSTDEAKAFRMIMKQLKSNTPVHVDDPENFLP